MASSPSSSSAFHHNFDRRPRRDSNEQYDEDEDLSQFCDIWTDASLFALGEPVVGAGLPQDSPTALTPTKKRKYSDSEDGSVASQEHLARELDEWLSSYLPGLVPPLPSIEDRQVDVTIANPFSGNADSRYAWKRQAVFSTAEDGAVNGYIKFRLRLNDVADDTPTRKRNPFARVSTMEVHQRALPDQRGNSVTYLPPDFGKESRLQGDDNKLMRFYTTAFCSGRTLLSKTNFWLVDIAAIADKNECVRHALLASTAGYVLDYLPAEKLRTKANLHYRKASMLLSNALSDPETQDIGKEDSILAAILLLSVDDNVNWEMRNPKELNPKWRQGTKVAKKILDTTDPGHRYWKAENVQSSAARQSFANRVAFIDILAQAVAPLQPVDDERLYGWLLEGTKAGVMRIHGCTGLSPKLLHTLAQDPESSIIPKGARNIEKRLEGLRQWSDLSEGYATPEQLMMSCILDSDGKVDNPTKVTELTAEAWRTATQIYMQSRFFRLPRSHPAVLKRMDRLCECIKRMPYTGPLFTCQAPFFPVFLIAIASYRPEHRQIAKDWFDVVVGNAGCRSSVPPVWRVVQDLWVWMDQELHEPPFDDNLPIGYRDPWWERVIGRLVETNGLLSLC